MKGLLLKLLLIQYGQNQTYQRLKIPKNVSKPTAMLNKGITRVINISCL